MRLQRLARHAQRQRVRVHNALQDVTSALDDLSNVFAVIAVDLDHGIRGDVTRVDLSIVCRLLSAVLHDRMRELCGHLLVLAAVDNRL